MTASTTASAAAGTRPADQTHETSPGTKRAAPPFATTSDVGAVRLRPMDLDRDADLAHDWVSHPKAAYWLMQGMTPEQTHAAHAELLADPHHEVWIGEIDGRATFLAETYDPARSAASPLRDVDGVDLVEGDLGMHLLLAPAATPVSGTSDAAMQSVLELCFGPLRARRVLVEPDVHNAAIHAKNARAGFTVVRALDLPGKTALLCTLEEPAFRASPLGQAGLLAHLRPEIAERAHRHLAAKAIGELTHERLLTPEATEVAETTEDERWQITTPSGEVWRFTATRHELEHWRVDPSSLERTVPGASAPGEIDAQRLLIELAPVLGIPDALLGTYLEEVASTHASLCFKLHHARWSAAELADADAQCVEGAMIEGHPAFIANNGRIGYSVADHRAYAPEATPQVRLRWLAARREATQLALAAGLSEADLYASELDEATRAHFAHRLTGLGLDPADYLYLPVHPWQLEHKIAVTFAPDLARRALVDLGEGPDVYRPQQSLRTFFNLSDRSRRYVKTACAIQNMGFLRGLSPKYMAATPAINDYVRELVQADPVLRAGGFDVLPEVAAIGYTGDAYHQTGVRSAQTKMIAALWRTPPTAALRDGERTATLAGALHRDPAGDSLLAAWITASGVEPRAWVRALLEAYVRPVVHCLGVYDLAFMPHSENVVLVLRDHLPVRALMKDIGEEVVVISDRPLPEAVERIRVPGDVELLEQSFFTDVMDGVLRYVAEILDDDGLLPEADFWAEVAACIERVEDEGRAAGLRPWTMDLRQPDFAHSCLNRLQLKNTLEMVDLTDPAGSLAYAGRMANPIAAGAAGGALWRP